jgi:AraC family transcriptional regulator
MATNHHDRIQRVHAAIHANPATDHTLDELADIAALSRFHFHRVFTAMTGETVAETVRRIRLGRAAQARRRGSVSVAQVGRDHGYPNAGSFSRAFRAAFGMTPSQFRAQPETLALPAYLAFTQGDPTMYPVQITTEPARHVIGVRHIGPYPQMGRSFQSMSEGVTKADLWPQVRGMVAVYFDDPAIVVAKKLRGLAAAEVPVDAPLPPGFVGQDLDGGRYAVVRVTGPYSGLAAAYDWLYGSWLAQSAETPRDCPCYEIYVNNPGDTSPQDLITDIYLPLQDAE